MGKPFSIVSELLILSALEVQPLEKSDSAIQEARGKHRVHKSTASKLRQMVRRPPCLRL